MNIPLPSRGDDILSWARTITTGVNAIAPIGGRGTLVKESTSGFGFEGLPENKRFKASTASSFESICEPIFDTDSDTGSIILSNVKNKLFPYGRQFYEFVTIDDDAKVSEGFIGLEITHVNTDEEILNPSAKVILISDSSTPGRLTNSDPTKTVVPLYTIKGGKIICDCRCLMYLAVRE